MSLSEKMQQLSKGKKSSQSLGEFSEIQKELSECHKQLQTMLQEAFAIVSSMQETGKDQAALHDKLQPELTNIRQTRQKIRKLQEQWQDLTAHQRQLEESEDDFEGIWHQPDTNIGQLVIDYNTSDVVYIMGPEIASMKLHLASQLPIPKSAWPEMLELILSQMGVGVRQVIPFVKQLYFLRMNQSGIQLITDDRASIEALEDGAKVAFVLAPPAGDLRRVYQFIERFSPQEQMSIQVVGGQLVVVGLVREVREILKVYDFISSPKRAQEYRLVALEKAESEEVAKILLSIFEGDTQKQSGFPSFGASNKSVNFLPMTSQGDVSFGFRVMPMKHPASSLFIMGKSEQIEKACQIIRDIEANIGEVQDKTIYWYACHHSEAEDLAKVLSQVYTKLLSSKGLAQGQGKPLDVLKIAEQKPPLSPAQAQEKKEKTDQWNIAHPTDSLIVPSSMVSLSDMKSSSNVSMNDNFIVDQKTNSIIMVVENFVLERLKELVRKLDIPKRMVQIDVLLFEKRVMNSSSFGLNLLKTGSKASGKHRESAVWNRPSGERNHSHKKGDHHHDNHHDHKDRGVTGVLEFALSRGKENGLPAYELAYQFLLSQEDIQINANPSVVTINQTPAKIAVVDQISINTGAVEYDRDHFKDAYSRAEYGTTIQITPTVHSKFDQGDEHLDEPKYVTLSTEICFDTTHPSHHDRPDVTRRNIKNEVRVRDGETVILGGLRKKHSTGSQQSIPFLGELPGIGKLFSTTALSDVNTEMFVFITPKIIPDKREAAEALRYQELMRRPGDVPEFLAAVERAKEVHKKALFEKSLQLILSPPIVSSTF